MCDVGSGLDYGGQLGVQVGERVGAESSRRRGEEMGKKGRSDPNRSCEPFS
jgi:hypothetical protein